MKKIFLFSLSLSSSLIFAQEAKQYFQQEVNYKINVKLDDVKNNLNADATLEYINNSPDELTFIWFHIWPNAYKNNNTALAKQLIADGNTKFYFASQQERGWIDGLDFKVDGQSIKTEPHPEHIDIIKLVLNQPLKAGGKITITTPFHVKIPIGIFSRLGHIGQQYQITQWYPKPAVYDQYGWHPMPYLNQGEFYSEFGSFDVSITLPKNYVVGATGTLVDGEKETDWLFKKVEETKAILKYNPRDTSFPASSSEMKTLRYQALNVHDFAWFADKRYHVLHDVVELPHSKKKVDTWVMFTNLEGELWKKALNYVSDAVYYWSLWNGDYPYPHATAVDGALSAGGGMEYPMITVIGQMGDDESLDRVIAHEVGHNWFYGILGSNERDHAWMDEGINSFNENRYMEIKYPKDSVKSTMQANIGGIKIDMEKLLGIPDLDESTLFDLAYRFNAVQKKDQPVDMTSAEYTQINYGTVVYGKAAVILEYLQAYLGEEMYDKCAQEYFEKWKFKHPYPLDIKKVYEEVSGKDLGWFFNEMIPTTKQVDYKICSVKKSQCENSFTGDCWEVKVKNKGKINSPFPISTIKNGKIVSTEWFEGFSGTKKVNIFTMEFDKVKIDAENKMPDINRQNNNYKMRGLCKKTEPFNLRMFGLIRNTDKTQLFWMPVMGWNNYNKFMLGAVVYNNFILEKKFEWVIMPMYSFHNKDLAGGASVHYNMHFDKIFQTIRFGAKAERYAYSNENLPNLNFNKIAPEILFEIKKKHWNSSLKQTINIRQVNVMKEIAVGDYNIYPPVYHYDTNHIAINDFIYTLGNSRKINPYDVSLNVQEGEGFVKSSLTANYHVTFKKKKKGLDIRFFGGTFIDNSSTSNYNFRMSGFSPKGTSEHDYLYDNIFLGRNEQTGILSQQFAEADGAFKTYSLYGQTNEWLVSLNFKSSLPGKIPFKLFADFTTVANQPEIFYTSGIFITLVPNIVDIYFPVYITMFKGKDNEYTLLTSKKIINEFDLHNSDVDGFKKYLRMIRFTFNIHKMNPFEFVRNLDL